MGRQRRIRFCVVCGAQLPQSRRKPFCLTCGISRAADAAIQLAQKQGPYYDKWKTGLLKYLETKENGETT